MTFPDKVYRAARRLRDSSEIFVRDIPLTQIVADDAARRPIAKATVDILVESIERLGLLSPIVVRPDAEGTGSTWRLITGRHRLEAYRVLEGKYPPAEGEVVSDWYAIPATISYTASDVEARLAEIAENLHRAELTKLERSDQIAEWVRLTEEGRIARQADEKRERGRPEGGVAAASRDLGISEPDARRSIDIARITGEAKEAARAAGLDDNQTALLKVARAEPERQVAVVHQLVHQKAASEPLNDIEANERQVAKLMTAWNAASPDARQEFLLRIEQPVMDRRFG